MKLGEGVCFQRLASFPELHLDVSVQVFRPGATSFRIWEDVSEPLNSKTYFKSHVAISGNFEMTMKFVDGSEEKVIIKPGHSWPHQEIKAGFRQVIGHPEKIEDGGENFCIAPIDTQKYSLKWEEFDLVQDQSKIIEQGKLIIIYGTDHSVGGVVRGTIESPWSLTACVSNQTEVVAHGPCRVLVYQSIAVENL